MHLEMHDRIEFLQVFEEDTEKGEGLPPELVHELYEFMKMLASDPAEQQKEMVAHEASALVSSV